MLRSKIKNKVNDKPTIVFVTYEIAPFIPGGAGAFLTSVITQILDQYNVIVLAMFGRGLTTEITTKFSQQSHPGVQFFFADDLLFLDQKHEIENRYHGNKYLIDSNRAYLALHNLIKYMHVDYIEFFDYTGIAYHTLYAKRLKQQFGEQVIVVRFQGPMNLIYKNEDYIPLDFVKRRMLKLEKLALAYADVYFTPSNAIWNELIRYFNIDQHARKILSAPQTALDIEKTWKDLSDNKCIFFYGKLQAIKGVKTLVEAGMELLKDFPELEFVIAGPDTNTTRSETSYREYIQQLIPEKYKQKFIFTGKIDSQTMQNWIQRSICAVVPSKWEAYNIAIHELKATGIPIIANEISAFSDFFGDYKHCIYFKNTKSSLVDALKLVLSDSNLRKTLSNNYEDYKDTPVGLSDAYRQLRMINDASISVKFNTKQLKESFGYFGQRLPHFVEFFDLLLRLFFPINTPIK